MSLQGWTAIGAAILHVIGAGAGILLLAGLWIPIVGTLVTLLELWSVFSQAGDPWIHILLGTLGAALALLEPGGRSMLTFSDGSASTLQTERVRSPTSLVLVLAHFKRLTIYPDYSWEARG